ncbi:MAG: DegT/DnrJ/EryC1/StrS family aminotransferase [Oscillospiraceae bacterium]|nr:DegT/DnrJ/EryC1/StrS family aminotransferase [Oscillospiraceae bacterium]
MDSKILVTRSSMPSFEEYCNEIKEIWDSRWLTNSGVKHQTLEKELSAFLGVSNLALCVNGHQALECIIEVLGLKGEVITTPFTFVSTTNAIVRKGLKPVFCDIKKDDFTIDPEKIEALITEKTSAIMPVHVYGNLCDDEAISKIAQKYNLKVIYDAAHAFGVKRNGVSSASLGDASMFSFHATKVFHSIEGGAAVFKDSENYALINQWKNFGINGEELQFFGGNSKMNEFAAAMGLCNLRHLASAIASRKEVVMRYRERLEGIKGLTLSAVQKNVESNYAYFPVVFDPAVFGSNRDDVLNALGKQGIGARKYFYPLTSSVIAFGDKSLVEKTPIAENISQNVLCLPLYEGLGTQNADRICNIIAALGKESL